MATFDGTISEFHAFIGPKVRNAINNLTKQSRVARDGICDHCHQKCELESAHKQGNGRKQITERVLLSYMNGDKIECDIDEVLNRIIAAHLPVEDIFIFLCSSCHKKYDAIDAVKVPKTYAKRSTNNNGTNLLINIEEEINRAIKSVGKECFVNYYDFFIDPVFSNGDIIDLIIKEQNYAKIATNTRVVNARWIIENNHDKFVLEGITISRRLTSNVKEKAKQLLDKYY